MSLASFFRSKKILITGHTGFKGSWLTFILHQWGAKITGYALEPNTTPNLFQALRLAEIIDSHYQDIRDYPTLERIIKQAQPEIVIHLAAQPLVRDSYDNPLYTHQTNIIGTANILQAIKEVKTVRAAVIITTDKVYENREWVWPYRETDQLGGHDPYSSSKACAELVVQSYICSFFNPAEYNQNHHTLIASTRAGNVIGGGDWAKDRLITDIVRSIFENTGPLSIRNPTAVRPWQHVLEPLTGYLTLAKSLYQGDASLVGGWNFSPQEENYVTVEELVQKAIAISGQGEYLCRKVTDKHEASLLKLDSAKAKYYLKWRPRLGIDQTLRWTFDWYRSFYQQEDVWQVTKIQMEKYFSQTGSSDANAEKLKNEIVTLTAKYFQRTSNPLPTNKVPVSGKVYDEKELQNMVKAVLKGWWTEEEWCTEFEQRLKDFVGIRHVVLTNSGSSANLLALKTLTSNKLGEKKIKPGDEVITTACGFPTTINPIIQIQAVPVFVDVELKTYNAKINQVEKAINHRTKAIILPHTLGNPFEVNIIKQRCQEYNIWLIEDNCDALGSMYNGQFTGTFGDLSTLSFYPAHHITTAEGGALLTNNQELYQISRSLRDWGRDCWCPTGRDNTCGRRFSQQLGQLPQGYDHKYTYSEIGYNLKMTDLQAAIGVAQVEKLAGFINKRKENFTYLKDKLHDLQEYFTLPQATPNSDPSWFGFPLTIKDEKIDRTKLLTYLNSNGVATRLLFAGNVTKQPYFVNSQIQYYVAEDLKNTDVVMKNTFWVGIYPALTSHHLDHLSDTIHRYINSTENHG